jgi:hypothetical protein
MTNVYEVLLKMLDRWNAHDIEGASGCVLEIARIIGCRRL